MTLRLLHLRFCYLLAAIVLVGCGSGGREPAVGEGFAAPATLNLRKDLGPNQPSVATVKHGERLEILARRRRFVKARTSSGVVGWIDGELLFTPEQMEKLRALWRWAEKLPSQGRATVMDTLNVHTDADREAPIFQQIREGDHIEVVAHRLVTDPRPEDWSLVRLEGAEAGWVLTRMLYMSIPDEVAQYAEGHRIMSYSPVGEVKDGEQVKNNWLWTTITAGGRPYDFDNVRLFVWSIKRHRYETAFIERRLTGYFPVEVGAAKDAGPTFSFIAEEKDGSLARRTYVFQGYRARLISRTPFTGPKLSDPPVLPVAEKAPAKSFWGRAGDRVAALRRKIFGR